jgi:hypothetical protein
MPGKAAKVVITERHQSVLQEIAAARTSEVRMSQRARIILLAFEGLKNEEVGAQVSMNRVQVCVSRKRWKAAFTQLVSVESTEPRDVLRKSILEVLADEHRSGRPAPPHSGATGSDRRVSVRTAQSGRLSGVAPLL